MAKIMKLSFLMAQRLAFVEADETKDKNGQKVRINASASHTLIEAARIVADDVYHG